ncbi:hypothetical protein OBBRIDRAFT_888453 [Obba rivulosa]|uniref:Uncharacterized protein n=1 Tax=Obba rivulosa TaxID=1052685 RepID=A0A8E2AWJ8_9APHY|nr:hypothetical protein OBBRIDRAFT_888453 [Obba rivulosa]
MHLAIPEQAAVHLKFRVSIDGDAAGHLVQYAVTKVLHQSTGMAAGAGSSTAEEKITPDPVEVKCIAMSLSADVEWTIEIQCRSTCILNGDTDSLPLRISIVRDEDQPPRTVERFNALLDGALRALSPCNPECLHYAGSPLNDGHSIIPDILSHFSHIRLFEIETLETEEFAYSLQTSCEDGYTQAIERLIFTDLMGNPAEFEEPLKDYISESGGSLKSLVIKTVTRSDDAGNLEDVSISEDVMEVLEDVVGSVEVSPLSEAESDKRLGDLLQHFGFDASWAA